MSDFPIVTTKLSDLISDEDSDSDSASTPHLHLNLGFAGSSSKTIDFIEDLRQVNQEDFNQKTAFVDLGFTIKSSSKTIDFIEDLKRENQEDSSQKTASVDWKEIHISQDSIDSIGIDKSDKTVDLNHLGFAESSSKTIDFIEDLKRENQEESSQKTASGDQKEVHISQDSIDSIGVDESDEIVDLNHNCVDTTRPKDIVNEDGNIHRDSPEPTDDNMSKRFGLLFQKGVRTKADKEKLYSESPKKNTEPVLPHLKSGVSLKPDYEESSFIEEADEVDEDLFPEDDKKSSSDTSKQDQSASTSTSDESELGSRADPVGESSDGSMAAAVETRGTSSEKSSDEDRKVTKTESVKESNESGKSEQEVVPSHVDNADIAMSLEQNGDLSSEDTQDTQSDVVNKDEATNNVKDEDDGSGGGDERKERPSLKRMERAKSVPGDHSSGDKDKKSEISLKEHKEQRTVSPQALEEGKNKKSTKKREPLVGLRATRSSLLRSKTIPNSDPHTRKSSRAESISSDESERLHKPGPPPPKDPVPDQSSDFKPYEHWQSLKAAQKADATNKITAKKEFSQKYHKHGLPRRAPSLVGTMGTPKHHASNISLASTATIMTNNQSSKSLLKPDYNPYGTSDKYLTPLQQKDKIIHDLQKEVGKLEETVALQGDEIANFQDEKEEALQHLECEKDAEMDEIFQEVKKLEDEKLELNEQLKKTEEALEEEKEAVANLQDKIAKMEIQNEEREEMHKRNYFQMYQKGREAQLIEQEEDLVCHAMSNPTNAPNKQLVTRLEKKEKELDKLRQTFRSEVYNKTPHLGSDSDAQVELLKSAVFYYLTDCQPDNNLRTMLSMLNYSEVQKKNIIRHLEKKKK